MIVAFLMMTSGGEGIAPSNVLPAGGWGHRQKVVVWAAGNP